jgi:hypothetical protein
MRGIHSKDFRPITRALSVHKKVSENTVLCIKHNFQLKLVCYIHSVALLKITLFKSKKFFIATHPSYLQGQWTQKNSRYISPVDHRSLDDLCTSTYKISQKLCALYVRCALSVLQKERRKVWVRRYTQGARYRPENTVSNILRSTPPTHTTHCLYITKGNMLMVAVPSESHTVTEPSDALCPHRPAGSTVL